MKSRRLKSERELTRRPSNWLRWGVEHRSISPVILNILLQFFSRERIRAICFTTLLSSESQWTTQWEGHWKNLIIFIPPLKTMLLKWSCSTFLNDILPQLYSCSLHTTIFWPALNFTLIPVFCEPFEFQCGSGECVLAARLLDGKDDCDDGSDEGMIYHIFSKHLFFSSALDSCTCRPTRYTSWSL